MQSLNNNQKFCRQYLLVVALGVAPAGFLLMNPMPLPQLAGISYATVWTVFQLLSLVLALAVPLLGWYGGESQRSLEWPVAAFLVAGLLFTAGLAVPTLGLLYQAAGRLVIATGLLTALSTARPTAPVSPTRRVPTAIAAAAGLVAVLASFPLALPATAGLGGGSLPMTGVLNAAATACYVLAALRARRFIARRRPALLLQGGLLLAACAAAIGAVPAEPGGAILLAAVYETAAYLVLGTVLLVAATGRPGARIARLTSAVNDFRSRYDRATREAAGNRTIMRDVMQQASTERSHRLMREMFEAVRAVTSGRATYEQTLRGIITFAAKSFDAHYLFLSLMEGKSGTLQTAMYQSAIPLEDLSWKNPFTRKVFNDAKTVLIHDLSHMGLQTGGEVAYGGFRSMLGVPIFLEGQPIGVLELLSRQGNSFSSQDAITLAVFAEHAAVVIHNTQVFTAGVRTVAQMKLLTACLEAAHAAGAPTAILASVSELLSQALKTQSMAAYVLKMQPDGMGVQIAFNQGFSDADNQNVHRILSGLAADRLLADNRGSASALLVQAANAVKRPNGRIATALPLYSRGMMQGLILYFPSQGMLQEEAIYESTLHWIAAHTAVVLEKSFLFESVREVGFTDALTGLANRRFFDFSLEREVGRARRYGRPLSLLLIDIDYFKTINDTYGHPAGDRVLKTLGDLLRNLFRKTDMTARYGGEEFVVVLPETGPDMAAQLAERFRETVARTRFATEETYLSLTVSVGVSTLHQENTDEAATETDLLLIADQALYRAKELGRNRVEK